MNNNQVPDNIFEWNMNLNLNPMLLDNFSYDKKPEEEADHQIFKHSSDPTQEKQESGEVEQHKNNSFKNASNPVNIQPQKADSESSIEAENFEDCSDEGNTINAPKSH